MSHPVLDYRRRVIDDELDELMATLPAIALEGPKAVGKTATASQRAGSIHRLDDPEERSIAAADLDRVLKTTPPVLIDELQHVEAVWDKVRRAVDDGATPGRFLLTGSASPDRYGTHSGAGRIVSLRMRPLSMAERLDDPASVSLADLLTGERPPIAGRTPLRIADYTDEIVSSGLPGLRGLSDRPLRRQLDTHLDRVVDRDFPEMGHEVRNPAGLRRWMRAYAAATSSSTTFEKIRAAATGGEETKPTRKTIQPYRDVLDRLFILDEVPGWQPSRNQIAELGLAPKHQLTDPALAARLLGATVASLLANTTPAPAGPRDGPLLGALFESLVTLSMRVYAGAAEAKVSHLRTHRGDHEVDLIVERDDGRVLAVEVKLGSAPGERSVRHLEWLGKQIGNDLLDALVVTTGPEAYRRLDGIAVVPLALLGP